MHPAQERKASQIEHMFFVPYITVSDDKIAAVKPHIIDTMMHQNVGHEKHVPDMANS